MSAAPVRFLAIGDLMIDVVVAGRGHDAVARFGPGGTAANVGGLGGCARGADRGRRRGRR